MIVQRWLLADSHLQLNAEYMEVNALILALLAEGLILIIRLLLALGLLIFVQIQVILSGGLLGLYLKGFLEL